MARPRQASDEDLLAATAAAVGRFGMGRLTLARVAEEAGVSPATLVQRFGSKRALLAAFTAWSAERVIDGFAAARASAHGPLEALAHALRRMAATVSSPEAFSHHFSLLQLDLTDPALREPAARHTRAMRAEIRRLLDEAVEAGDLVPTDVRALATAVHAVHNGSLLTWALDPHGEVTGHLAADLSTLLAPYRDGMRPGTAGRARGDVRER